MSERTSCDCITSINCTSLLCPRRRPRLAPVQQAPRPMPAEWMFAVNPQDVVARLPAGAFEPQIGEWRFDEDSQSYKCTVTVLVPK